MNQPLTRRAAVERLGLLGIGASVAACGAGRSVGEELEAPASCILTPRQIEGPYFVDTGLVRRDITEGRPGVPLTVRLRLVDVDRGREPIPDAAVAVWHADAGGSYSGFDVDEGNVTNTPGDRFLRGFQTSDGGGRVEFATIHPAGTPSVPSTSTPWR